MAYCTPENHDLKKKQLEFTLLGMLSGQLSGFLGGLKNVLISRVKFNTELPPPPKILKIFF